MKKSKIILSTLLPLAAVAATATVAVSTLSLTSCSNSSLVANVKTYDVNLKTSKQVIRAGQNEQENQQVQRPSILPNVPNTTMPDDNEIDANFNKNPLIDIYNSIKKSISTIVTADINDVIVEFLSCMEQENGKEEIEILDKDDNHYRDVITNVRVRSGELNKDEFFKTRKLPLLVDVLVEKEINGRERKVTVPNVELDLYVEFAGQAEVLDIVNRVQNSKQNSGGKFDTDYEDIMELLVGDKDDKDPFDFDFDDIFNIKKDSSIEDIGLLKYMSNYNNVTNSNAKMFGYTFDIEQFWNSLSVKAKTKRVRKTTQKNTVFWAPSTSLCTLFVPKLNNQADLNASISQIREKYETFNDLQNKLNEIKNDATKVKPFLEEIGIQLPANLVVKTAKLEAERTFGSIKKIELEITDQFGNDYEFDFYSNWWSRK